MNDDRFYPSLFDSRETQRRAQGAALRYWSSYTDENGEPISPAALLRAIENERELRYRRIIGGAVKWIGIGYPIMWGLLWILIRAMAAA